MKIKPIILTAMTLMNQLMPVRTQKPLNPSSPSAEPSAKGDESKNQLPTPMAGGNAYGSRPTPSFASKDTDVPIDNLRLTLAIVNGDLEHAMKFTKSVEDVNVIDPHGYSALHYAINQNYPEIVKALMHKGADPHQPNMRDGLIPVQMAAKEGAAEILDELIQAGGMNHIKNTQIQSFGFTLLHLAALNGGKNMVQSLVKSGIGLDMTTFKGDTALHLAAKSGNSEFVGELIRQGANSSIVNHEGKTALDVAKNKEIKDLLRSAQPSTTQAEVQITNQGIVVNAPGEQTVSSLSGLAVEPLSPKVQLNTGRRQEKATNDGMRMRGRTLKRA